MWRAHDRLMHTTQTVRDRSRNIIRGGEVRDPLLINTARGQLVDQEAVDEALRDGTIAGAGLDVCTQEPIAPDDPLLTLPHLVLSPHTAGTTPEALMHGLNLCAANVVAFV